MLQVREDAIIQAVNRLLAQKGFDAMTVDEIAGQVGIAKASLYKHFPSKEDLAAAAMARAMRQALAYCASLPDDAPPVENLRAAARWAMERKLAGQMPALPSQNSNLRAALMANRDCMDGLIEVSHRLRAWIEAARLDGSINSRLPATAVLYTLYARACDPFLEFLQTGGQHRDEEIIDLFLSTCFDGLIAR